MMSPLLHVLHNFSAVAAAFLVDSVWEGFIVATCVAVLLRLLPGLTAAVRSAIWVVVLLLVMLVPGLSLFTQGHGGPAAAHAGLLHASETWSLALLGVWAAISLLRISQLAESAIRLRGVARRAVTVEPGETVAALLRGSRRRVELSLSTEVDRPSVAGFFRPRILLSPELYAALSEPELRQVMLHEVEHLRRYDDWTNLLQKLSLALVPLHPVLVWVDRQMCLERELACDDYVLGQTPRKAYASCLARVAEASMVRRGFSLALGALGRRERTSELANRVHRILRAPEKRMSRGGIWVATAMVLGVVFAGAAGLARSPELISFAPTAQPFAASQQLAAARSFATAPRFAAPRFAAPRFAAPRMEAANFHSTSAYAPFAAHETLVKAVTPEREMRPLRMSAMRKSTRRVRRLVSVNGREIARREIAWREVAARESEAESPRIAWIEWRQAVAATPSTLTISEDPQFLYAAVPVRDGWLIFQL